MLEKESYLKNRKEIIISRTFDAPLKSIWNAWGESERFMRWWGPKGFTSPFCEIDFRVGGKYLFCMRSPHGKEYWNTGTFRKIIPYERIVCTNSFADENGKVVPASYYGMDSDWSLELILIITLEKQKGKSKLTLHQVGFPSDADSESAKKGWNESFDKLAESLVNE
jgi:uncharacterized protein YndB with AHSA1/START domain